MIEDKYWLSGAGGRLQCGNLYLAAPKTYQFAYSF
jgi:hypothetical protein